MVLAGQRALVLVDSALPLASTVSQTEMDLPALTCASPPAVPLPTSRSCVDSSPSFHTTCNRTV